MDSNIETIEHLPVGNSNVTIDDGETVESKVHECRNTSLEIDEKSANSIIDEVNDHTFANLVTAKHLEKEGAAVTENYSSPNDIKSKENYINCEQQTKNESCTENGNNTTEDKTVSGEVEESKAKEEMPMERVANMEGSTEGNIEKGNRTTVFYY